MYFTPDVNRLSKLDTSAMVLGDTLMFCPSCDWQSSTLNGAMQPFCPTCQTRLHITKADQELLDL